MAVWCAWLVLLHAGGTDNVNDVKILCMARWLSAGEHLILAVSFLIAGYCGV